MSIDFGKASDKFDAVMSTTGGENDMVQGGGVFTVTCHNADGLVLYQYIIEFGVRTAKLGQNQYS